MDSFIREQQRTSFHTTMASKKRPLRDGKGATASLLTKFISPKVAVEDKTHRSEVVLVDRYEDGKKKLRYSFHLKDDDTRSLFNSSRRYMTILEEGDPSFFFKKLEGDCEYNSTYDGFKEPKKEKWAKSHARKLLYNDIKKGFVGIDATVDNKFCTDVYMMHQEYAAYNFDNFPSRIKGIQKIIKKNLERADDDQASFDKFCENNPVSQSSHYGYIQWQGSDAQKLVKKDIKNGVISSYTKEKYKYPKMAYWLTKEEFYDEFPLQAFRDKIRQEIRTSKYEHTLKVRGKKNTYKYS